MKTDLRARKATRGTNPGRAQITPGMNARQLSKTLGTLIVARRVLNEPAFTAALAKDLLTTVEKLREAAKLRIKNQPAKKVSPVRRRALMRAKLSRDLEKMGLPTRAKYYHELKPGARATLITVRRR